jgi:excisionase family DNA binding protein
MEQLTGALPRLLRAKDVATALGVRPAFVYALARRHAIPVIRVGRYFRFDPVALECWKEAGGSPDGEQSDADGRPLRRRPRRIG